MGRLMKKKPADRKKKKSASKVGAETAVIKNTGAKQAGLKSSSMSNSIVAKVVGPGANKGEGFIFKAAQFLREVKVELKKVTWPSRKQTLGSTAVVILLVMIISLFLGIVDIGLSSLVKAVLQ